MFYTNARIFIDNEFRMGAFEVVDGKFGAILPENVPADAIDLGGATEFGTNGTCTRGQVVTFLYRAFAE